MKFHVINRETRRIVFTGDDRHVEVVFGITGMGKLDPSPVDQKIKEFDERLTQLQSKFAKTQIEMENMKKSLEQQKIEGVKMIAEAWYGRKVHIKAMVGEDAYPKHHQATVITVGNTQLLRIDDAGDEIAKEMEYSINCFVSSDPSAELLKSINNDVVDGSAFWIESPQGEKIEFIAVGCSDGVVRWKPIVEYGLGIPNRPMVPRSGDVSPRIHIAKGGNWEEILNQEERELEETEMKKHPSSTRIQMGVDGGQPLWAAIDVRRCGNIDLVKWDRDEYAFARTMNEIDHLVQMKKMEKAFEIQVGEIPSKSEILLPSGAVLKLVYCEDKTYRWMVDKPTPAGYKWKGDDQQ